MLLSERQSRMYSWSLRRSNQKTVLADFFHLLLGTAFPTISSDNLVDILSRVAEGKGPVKPQQPVSFPETLVLSPPGPAGRDKIVCPARLFFSATRKRLFCWPLPLVHPGR